VLGFGRYRKNIIRAMIWMAVIMLATPALANIRFFSIVQQTCKQYRIPVTMGNMTLEGVESGNGVFNLGLQSRRNNFEEVMMVGYIAAGQAIARTGLGVKTIHVMITIPKADNMMLMSTASIALVDNLRTGKIKSSEFMRQIQWN